MKLIQKNMSAILIGVLFTLISLQTTSAYYDPGVQRWINRDPIREAGFKLVRGGRVSRGSDPNLYLFCRNSPVHHRDAFGLKVDLCCALGVARRVVAAAHANYTGPGADAAWHCYAGCQLAKLCNQETATAAGVLHEISDAVRGFGVESRDYMNTRIGAEECGIGGGDCRSCCQKLWDDGELF